MRVLVSDRLPRDLQCMRLGIVVGNEYVLADPDDAVAAVG